MAIRHDIGFTKPEVYIDVEQQQKKNSLSHISPINLDYYGIEQCEKGYFFGPFTRTSFVIHFVKKGKGILRMNGREFQVHGGQCFILFQNVCTTYQADLEDPWEYSWIGFHGYEADAMVRKCGFTEEHPVINSGKVEEIHEIMERLLAAAELTYVNRLRRMSAMLELFAVMVEDADRDTHTENITMEQAYVRSAANMLMDAYGQSIRVEDVARSIGLSRNYLTTIFKQEMQVSMQEFLIAYRMEKAAGLLHNTSSPVRNIAESVGYTDSLSFSKAFKKRYGLSPKAFRDGDQRLD